jgi:hypothetical protein
MTVHRWLRTQWWWLPLLLWACAAGGPVHPETGSNVQP